MITIWTLDINALYLITTFRIFFV